MRIRPACYAIAFWEEVRACQVCVFALFPQHISMAFTLCACWLDFYRETDHHAREKSVRWICRPDLVCRWMWSCRSLASSLREAYDCQCSQLPCFEQLYSPLLGDRSAIYRRKLETWPENRLRGLYSRSIRSTIGLQSSDESELLTLLTDQLQNLKCIQVVLWRTERISYHQMPFTSMTRARSMRTLLR